jgi:hypothetical protein
VLDAHLVHVDDRGEKTSTRYVNGDPFVAIGLSFPRFDDSGAETRVRYRINLVKLRELFENEVDEEEQQDADEG